MIEQTEKFSAPRNLHLTVKCPDTAFLPALKDLRLALDARGLCLSDRYPTSALLEVEFDKPATGARVLVMRFEPADRLRRLVAAVRAGKRQKGVVKQSSHGGVS